MKFLIPFLLITNLYPCTIKQYIHRGVPAFVTDCQTYPDDPFCEYEDPHQYAITWISFLRPASVKKLDVSPYLCARRAEELHTQTIESADNLHWGHETKFKALFLKGKLKYRNPNYIEANL